MQKILSGVRRFFTGVRLILPIVPRCVWFAIRRVIQSTIDYWKASQLTVNDIADFFTDEAMQKLPSEYDTQVYWLCYSLASFLYLVGWLAQALLTVAAFRLLVSAIF